MAEPSLSRCGGAAAGPGAAEGTRQRDRLAGCRGLSLAVLAVYSRTTYGLWNPASVYDAFTGGYRPSLVTRYRVGIGSLFSRNEGLFVVLPLSWLAMAGLGRVLRRCPLEAMVCGALLAVYLLAVLPSGARGTSPPPRLVVALVPLVLVGVWLGFSEHRV